MPWGAVARWFPFRAIILLPFIFVAPEIYQAITVGAAGVDRLVISTADVFGNGAIICLWLMLAVTPVITMTGWTWHRPLRQSFGIGMFACALADFIIALLFSGSHFAGGPITRIAGHAVLLAGTIAFLLTIPLVITATHRSQRWLGPHWKWLHKLVYFLWGAVVLHMLFLFGFSSFFLNALEVSIPLVIMRIPAVRTWWVKSRKDHAHLVQRWVFGIALAIPYFVGLFAFFHELIDVGVGAILLHPPG